MALALHPGTLWYQDIEGALRTWLRQQPEMVKLCGEHIYFAAPDISRRIQVALPPPKAWLAFQRLGGGPEVRQHLSLDQALITFHGYGRTRYMAAQVTGLVLNLLGTVGTEQGPLELVPGVRVMYSQTTLYAYEQDQQVPRYVLDLGLTTLMTVPPTPQPEPEPEPPPPPAERQTASAG